MKEVIDDSPIVHTYIEDGNLIINGDCRKNIRSHPLVMRAKIFINSDVKYKMETGSLTDRAWLERIQKSGRKRGG